MKSLKTILTGPDKWCKGLGFGPKGTCCLIGAAKQSFNCVPSIPFCLICDTLDASAKELFPDRMENIHLTASASFNDHPDTTFEDVIKVIEHAEAKLCSAST